MDSKDDKESKERKKPRRIGATRPAPWPNNPHLKQIKSKAEYLAIKAQSDD